MLVDLLRYFNYYEIMPEATLDTPVTPSDTDSGNETAAKPEKTKPQANEIQLVAGHIFHDKIAGKTDEKIASDPAAARIKTCLDLQRLTQEDIDANDTTFPAINDPDGKGNRVIITTVDRRTGRLDEISGISESDDYLCTITLNEGKDTETQITGIPVSRKEIFTQNMLAERQRIEAGFTDGNQTAIIKAYFDSIDPDIPENAKSTPSREQVQTVAEKTGMLTSTKVAELIQRQYPDESSRPQEVTGFLQKIEGITVIDQPEFRDMLRFINADRNGLHTRADNLQSTIERISKIESPNAFEQRQFDDAQNELAIVAELDKTWGAAEPGGTPYDRYLGGFQTGEINAADRQAFLDNLDDMSNQRFDTPLHRKMIEDAQASQETPMQRLANEKIETVLADLGRQLQEKPGNKELEKQILKLQLVHEFQGENSILWKHQALKDAVDPQSLQGQKLQEDLDALEKNDAYKNELQQATDNITKQLENAHFKEDEIKQALESEDGLMKLMANEKFKDLQGFAESVIGKDLSYKQTADIQRLMEKTIEAYANPKDKLRLKEIAKKGGKGLFITILATVAVSSLPAILAAGQIVKTQRG